MQFNKKTIVSLFIAMLMILSVAGFLLSETDSGQTLFYKEKHKFIKLQQGYRTKIDGKDFIFNYYPSQLEDINAPQFLPVAFNGVKVVSITYEPRSQIKEIMAELQYFDEGFFNQFDIFVQRGVTEKTEESLDVLDCTNATQEVPLIRFTEGNETKIEQKERCIILQAQTSNEMVRAHERFLYSYLKVMD